MGYPLIDGVFSKTFFPRDFLKNFPMGLNSHRVSAISMVFFYKTRQQWVWMGINNIPDAIKGREEKTCCWGKKKKKFQLMFL